MSFKSRSTLVVVETEEAQFCEQGGGVVEPGLLVPPSASVGTMKRRVRASESNSRFVNGHPPYELIERPGEGSFTDCTPEEFQRCYESSPARVQFRRLYFSGRFAEARRLAEAMHDRYVDRVEWVHNLASVAYEQGNLSEAHSLYLTNAHLLDTYPDLYSVGNYNLSFGMVAQELWTLHGVREFALRADKAYCDAARFYMLAGFPLKVAYAENNRGWLKIVTGEPERAHEYLDRAALLFNDAGELARVYDVEDTRALAFEAEGRLDEAFECSSHAVLALRKFGEAERKSFEAACGTHDRIFKSLLAEPRATCARIGGMEVGG